MRELPQWRNQRVRDPYTKRPVGPCLSQALDGLAQAATEADRDGDIFFPDEA